MSRQYIANILTVVTVLATTGHLVHGTEPTSGVESKSDNEKKELPRMTALWKQDAAATKKLSPNFPSIPGMSAEMEFIAPNKCVIHTLMGNARVSADKQTYKRSHTNPDRLELSDGTAIEFVNPSTAHYILKNATIVFIAQQTQKKKAFDGKSLAAALAKPKMAEFATTIGDFDWSKVDAATEAQAREQWGKADEEYERAAFLGDKRLMAHWREVRQVAGAVVRQIELARKANQSSPSNH